MSMQHHDTPAGGFDAARVRSRIDESIAGSRPNGLRRRRHALWAGGGTLGAVAVAAALALGPLAATTGSGREPIAGATTPRSSGGTTPIGPATVGGQAGAVVLLRETAQVTQSPKAQIVQLTQRSSAAVNGVAQKDESRYERIATATDGTATVRELLGPAGGTELAARSLGTDHDSETTVTADYRAKIWTESTGEGPEMGYADADGSQVTISTAGGWAMDRVGQAAQLASDLADDLESGSVVLVRGSEVTQDIDGVSATCFSYEGASDPAKAHPTEYGVGGEVCVDAITKRPLSWTDRWSKGPRDEVYSAVTESQYRWHDDTPANRDRYLGEIDTSGLTKVSGREFAARSTQEFVY